MNSYLHTCYRVGEIARSVAFYEHLGFAEVRRMDIGDEAINVFMALPGEAPGKICLAIAEWQHFNPKTEKVGLNLVKAGPAGWSTSGDAKGTTGDSWFTGETKAATHVTQVVSAKVGTTLYFMCAIHPWMQGSIKVVAPVVH